MMRTPLSIAALLLSLPNPTSGQWGGCVNPNDPEDIGLVQIGRETTICLTVGPGGNWGEGVNYLRFNFRPEADEYSTFHIPNSYNAIVTQGVTSSENSTVHVASGTSVSFLRHYYEKETKRIYPHLTAIIDVNDGVVGGIAWDNACVFCNSNRCLENTFDFNGNIYDETDEQTSGCYLDKRECDVIMDQKGTDCDVTLYVVWTGTDVNSKPFVSATRRFSAFPSEQIQNKIKDQINKFEIPKLPELPDFF
mmetsp:Transcript_3264/g.4951  ORF Transcript_3264/g.4951 Transcript_3264/m.4951 type:complete len:250 (-) Transcript_3264:202-951(-)